MKVSPVGASPLGPSIAFPPIPTTLNLERIEKIYHIICQCLHDYTGEDWGL